MTKTIIALALFGLAALADAQTIQGRWKLLAAEDMRADGSVARLPWGKNPVGAIVVQGGHCYVQIMSSDVPTFTAATPSVSEQMSAALLSTYIAYSGPCTIDEAQGRVDLRVTAAWRPGYAENQTRYFLVEGDTLYFGPTARIRTDPPWDPSTIAAGSFTRRLTLERAP